MPGCLGICKRRENMDKEVLTVNVRITDIYDVKGGSRNSRMILFEGDAVSDCFTGSVLPGGVDTQRDTEDGRITLSARYMLEGKDLEGRDCRIFIENNGVIREGEEIMTVPSVITDSPSLAYLEDADLYGTVEETQGGVRIHIFRKDDEKSSSR